MKIERTERVKCYVERGMTEKELCSFITAKFDEPDCNVAEIPREDEYVIVFADFKSHMFFAFWDSQMHSFHSLEEIVELYSEREYIPSEINFGKGELKLSYEIDVKE